MGSSVGSVGSDESSGGVATTLGTGLLVIVRAVLLVLLLLVIAVAVTAYLLNHAAGVLSRV